MKNRGFVFLNGRLVPASRAVIPVLDRGLLLGDALFETVRIYRSVPFRWPEHFRRLREGCRTTEIPLPYSSVQWREIIRRLVRKNRQPEAALRITITRGAYGGSLSYGPHPRPTVIVFLRPFRRYPAERYRDGVGIITSSVKKAEVPAGQSAVKSTNYLPHILAKREADRRGCHEAVMLNARGLLTECSTSSLFFLRGNTLCTPSLDLGILSGITRTLVIRLAEKRGLRVAEGRFRPASLSAAREAFLTSSLREIMPVTRFDGKKIGSGRPGPITQALMRDYQGFVESH